VRVLGIETATQICGVAITEDKQLLGEYRLNIKNVHSERLVGAIEKLLGDTNLQPKELQGIAVSIGPGSFTGLRIGLSVAKGMAFSLDIPLVAVPTLEALAWQAPINDGDICVLIKARAELVYFGRYQKQGESVTAKGDVRVIEATKLDGFAEPGSIFIGSGTEMAREIVEKLNGRLLPSRYSLLSGFTIATLGTERLLRGEIEELRTVEPLYIQQFIAHKPKDWLGM
jgi:tRNA threonylcarbamoyladenosine biosynthesis protein TsaB